MSANTQLIHAAAERANADEIDFEALSEEIERLQRGLAFWMPGVPDPDHPLHERMAKDAYLLAGYDGPNNEPSVYELGHASIMAVAPVQSGLLPLPEFDSWLRSACFQRPPDHAYDLARCAWVQAAAEREQSAQARIVELEAALRHIEGVAMAYEPRDLPGIAQTARAALEKTK